MRRTYTNREFGALGERFAAAYLRKLGYKILEKNYKNTLGEIDIIAEAGGEIVFVEVKTRSARPYLSGKYSVDKRKQHHIMRTASAYTEFTGCTLQPRFDVIEIEIDRSAGRLVDINHIKHAFSQTSAYAPF